MIKTTKFWKRKQYFLYLFVEKIYDRRMKRKFQPPFIATLLALVMLIGLGALGTWQLYRLEWKTQRLAQIESRMKMPVVAMPERIGNPDDWEYRRVVLRGRFIYGHEFLIKPRTLDGVNGAHMLVPFERAFGGIVMVNRGWISDELMPKVSRPAGLTQIEGVIQKPRASFFTPANDPEKGAWYWADIPAMARAANLEIAPSVLVQSFGRAQDAYPAAVPPFANFRNDHKQYAFFWYGMALVWCVIFFIRYWRPVKEMHEDLSKA